MDSWDKRRQMIVRVAIVLAACAAFALAYTQAPLYTSNQNQYFLHGLAQGGFGALDSDWLAQTIDPTPVFSKLVEMTFRLGQLEGLSYFYYGILMGIYLISLAGIIRTIFPQSKSPEMTLTILAGLIVIHSAGLRFVFSRLVGVNWTYILEDGVADQRLLGAVFQPSTFGVFLLLSIFLFLNRKNILAVLCAVIAPTFHPTYLLSAGILIIVYLFILHWEKVRLRDLSFLGLLSLMGVLPILLYVFLNFGNTPPETSTAAQQILVDFRIPHHADITWWFDATVVVKLLIMMSAVFLVRRTRLFYILFLPLLMGLGLTLIQVISDSPTLALLFPWRVTTWLVPLSTAVLIGRMVELIFHKLEGMKPNYQRIITIINLVIILLAVSAGISRTFIDFSRQASQDDQALMAWVKENHSHSDRYLVPVKMQDFRLVTGVPIFVDFKSIPYRDSDVLEWYRRIRLAEKFYRQGNCDLIDDFYIREKINYLVLPEGEFHANCPQLILKFQDNNYSIYSLEN